MAESPRVSFCATDLNTVGRLKESIESVETLGKIVGAPFEIVVAEGPSTDGSTEALRSLCGSRPFLKVVTHQQKNRGYGRRLAFEASSGQTIVPFDTSLSYSPDYGDLLRRYLALSTPRMLFSEVCALSRESILKVGGWRDLIGGEDLDLYARIIVAVGVLAYPTGLRGSQSARMSSFARQMRYERGSWIRQLRRIYEVQRDQIIGGNYRVEDLMDFNRRKSWARRVSLRVFFTLAYWGSRRSAIRPFQTDRNNYLVLRDALLESLDRSDYLELHWAGHEPRLPLTEDEVGYLSQRSRRWHELGTTVDRYVVPK